MSSSNLRTVIEKTSTSKPSTKTMVTTRRRIPGRLQDGEILKQRSDLIKVAFEERDSGMAQINDERGRKPDRPLAVTSVQVKRRKRKELERQEQTAWKW